MKIVCNNEILFDAVKPADTFALRFQGLMFRKKLEPSEGLLLLDCSRIHTNFMRFPIDVVYLSEELRILDVETVRPWRIGKRVKGTRHVLEVPENAARKLKLGELIARVG